MKNELKVITTNCEPAIDLILTKTKVIMKITEESLDSIKEDIDQELEKPEKFAWVQKLKGFVINKVEKLLHKSIEYTLDELNDLKYENGSLVFDYETKHMLSFETLKIDTNDGHTNVTAGGEGNVLSRFDEADAKAFLEAFHGARKNYMDFINN